MTIDLEHVGPLRLDWTICHSIVTVFLSFLFPMAIMDMAAAFFIPCRSLVDQERTAMKPWIRLRTDAAGPSSDIHGNVYLA